MPGVYEAWPECQNQINGFSGAVYKGFVTKEKASSKVCVQFVKVKGHSGERYNELVDKLAKEALGIKYLGNLSTEEK